MAIPTIQLTGKVLGPDGVAPTAGTITVVLSEPGTVMDGGTAQLVAGRSVWTLGVDGSLPAAADLVPNDAITRPGATAAGGTYYTALYDLTTGGKRITFEEEWVVASAPSSLDIGDVARTVTPGTVPVGVDVAALLASKLDTDGNASAVRITATGSTTARTAAAIAADVVNVKAFGAVGNGVANDTAAIQAAVTAADALSPRVATIYLPAGTYLVTAITNPVGHVFVGPGRITKAITGGQQQLTSYADIGRYVIGREYLSALHKRIIARTVPSTIVFTGDSTTAGDATTSPYRIWELIPRYALAKGIPQITGTNRGQSGTSTYDWITTYLAGDLALNPDVLVVRWGINDPYTGGARPSYQRTLDEYAADLRSGLATIRAARTVAQTSIVLMMPNSVSDTPQARDEKWHEQLYPILVKAARDYQCVFVDTYAYLRDSRDSSGAGDWMDDPYADGRHIHPLNVANAWIASLLGEVLFPDGLAAQHAENHILNVSNNQVGYAGLLATAQPSTFARGVTIHRAQPANGWPYDGAVMTIAHADNVWLQINFSYTAAYVRSVAIRSSSATTTWGMWWKAEGSGKLNPTWGAAISIDAATALYHEIVATSAVAAVIGDPNIKWVGQRLTIVLKNTSGGALGGTTWNAIYKMAAWVDPANGFSRTISFLWNGANYVEESRTPADVPN